MRCRAWLTVVLALPALGAALVSACGGAVEQDDFVYGSQGARPGRRPGGGGRDPGSSGAVNPVVDAAAAACACTDELEQVDGSCNFVIGPRLIACVADHTASSERDAAAAYAPLEGVTSCGADAGASWTPSSATDRITLCGCAPGEAHSLCVRYF